MGELQGRVCLITGAAKRLGRAFALALAERGAAVAVHYHSSKAEAEAVLEQVRGHGVEACGFQADLADPQQATGLVERVAAELATPDLLINNASVFDRIGFFETDLQTWDKNLAVNLRAPFLLSQTFARRLGERPGSIVNLLDFRALRPGTDSFSYTVAKAGLVTMTRSLAQVLAPAIRVNGLALGAILPPSSGGGGVDRALLDRVPAGRLGRVDEVVEALLFLLSGPGYVTGDVLHLDGGRQLT